MNRQKAVQVPVQTAVCSNRNNENSSSLRACGFKSRLLIR